MRRASQARSSRLRRRPTWIVLVHADGDLALSVRDWRRDAVASCVAAQTDRVLAARSGLVAAQRVE